MTICEKCGEEIEEEEPSKENLPICTGCIMSVMEETRRASTKRAERKYG